MPELIISPVKEPLQTCELWPGGEDIPPGFISENNTYYLELQHISNPGDYDLYIDGLMPDALRSPDETTARWKWSVGFHAGKVTFLLMHKNIRISEIEIITDPAVEKLTREEFEIMVEEIMEDTHALFSLSSFRTGISKGTVGQLPPLARLEYLRSRMDGIEKAVNDINTRPARRLRAIERKIPLHKAGKITPREFTRSFQRNAALASIDSSGYAGGIKHLPLKLNKRIKTTGLDIKEHQVILNCLQMWISWLSVASSMLTGSDPADPDVNIQRKLWAHRCQVMARRLEILLALPLFGEVSTGKIPAVTTPIFRGIDAYRRFFRLQRDFHLGLGNILGDYLNLPLAQTYDLYELWSFLRLLRAAIVKFNLDHIQTDSLFQFDEKRNSVRITSGEALVPLGNGLCLAFQLRYQEFWNNPLHRGSFSRTMIPDISITCDDEQEICKVIVLDAKYRIRAGLNDAIASIHMYRDALIQEERGSHLKRIVAGAYLLTPHIPNFSESWKSSKMPDRLFHPEYRTAFKFGAVMLKPGMALSEVIECFEKILEDADLAHT